MPKRWYDIDSTLSLAVSMLKNSTEDLQDKVCELVEDKFKEMGIKRGSMFTMFKVFDNRWYDERESVYNVLETLRCCEEEQQREVALFIIDYLCNIVD